MSNDSISVDPVDGEDYDAFGDLTYLALDLLDKAYECLEDTHLGKPADKYLYYSEPIADCCNSVVVWLREFRPVQAGKFPNENFENIRSCSDLRYMPIFVISVFRPCAPNLKNDRINPLPSPKEIHTYSKNIYEDARVLQCCILDSLFKGDKYGGESYKVGSSVKFIPKNIEIYDLATCVRIDLPVLFDMDSCC